MEFGAAFRSFFVWDGAELRLQGIWVGVCVGDEELLRRSYFEVEEGDCGWLVQCFWPDKGNRLPWEGGCDDYVKSVQPLLYIH